MPRSASSEFVFSTVANSSIISLKEILDFVNNNLPDNIAKVPVNFKVKVIVSELLNNAIKHAGDAETTFHIFIDDETIGIQKTDYGRRFNPNNLLSMPGTSPGTRIKISEDVIHKVYAIIENQSMIRFTCVEDTTVSFPDVLDIMEHFGLLIITKSADKFTYEYDYVTGLNKFSVILRLN